MELNNIIPNYSDIEDKRVVLLQSGGLDSNIIACILKYYGFEIHHIFVNYGQNMVDKEREYSKKIAEYYGGENYTYSEVDITLPWLNDTTNLVDHEVTDYEAEGELNANLSGSYVPLRNHILLSIAGSYAEAYKIPYIACAFDGSEDFYGRPLGGTTDKHPTFVDAIENSICEGSAYKHIDNKFFTILTPVMDLCKDEIIKLGLHFHADMSISWSCYNKANKPCGKCSACATREEAFRRVGIEDPSLN